MTLIQGNVRTEEFRQRAKHVLFVEGSNDRALDPQVLSVLLPMVDVKALGASFHIRSAAEALYTHHPTYYFLVDRDYHHDDNAVDNSWNRFPDPQTSNILIWRRRELENYFLIPEYLEHSDYLIVSGKELRDRVRRHSQERLFLDVANQVIVSFREEFKIEWVRIFTNIDAFGSPEQALAQLKAMPEWEARKNKTVSILDLSEVERRFVKTLNGFSGGRADLEYGHGHWLEMISGKKVLNQIVGACFQVLDLQGRPLQGPECLIEVTKDLLRKAIEAQPDDLQRLRKLIEERVNAG